MRARSSEANRSRATNGPLVRRSPSVGDRPDTARSARSSSGHVGDRTLRTAGETRCEESCDTVETTQTRRDRTTTRDEWIGQIDPRIRRHPFDRFAGGRVTWQGDLGGSWQRVDREIVNKDFRPTFVDDDL